MSLMHSNAITSIMVVVNDYSTFVIAVNYYFVFTFVMVIIDYYSTSFTSIMITNYHYISCDYQMVFIESTDLQYTPTTHFQSYYFPTHH